MGNLKQQPLKQGKPIKSRQVLKAKSHLKKGQTIKATGLRKTANSKLKSIAKPRTKSVSQLKKLADKYHSLATRYRFADLVDGVYVAECFTCGQVRPIKELQCGHFMGRAHNAVRYVEENTAPQCYGCNVMQQGRQYIFGMKIDAMYGDGTAKRLYKESREPHQFKRAELEEIIRDTKAQVLFYETQL